MLLSITGSSEVWSAFRGWYADQTPHPPLYNGHRYRGGDMTTIPAYDPNFLDDFRRLQERRMFEWEYIIDVNDEDALYLMLRFDAKAYVLSSA